MTPAQRLAAIREGMRPRGLDLLVAIHDGAHFIETANPVLMLSGFKSLGAAATVLSQAEMILVVTPAWDAKRACDKCLSVGIKDIRIVASDDLIDGLKAVLEGRSIGLVGLSTAPFVLANRLTDMLRLAVPADEWVYAEGATRTEEEISNAREATRIAEQTFRHMIDIVRPGMSEDELALELKWHSKTLGAEDNFLLLYAGPHNRAVQSSTGRRMQTGDIVLVRRDRTRRRQPRQRHVARIRNDLHDPPQPISPRDRLPPLQRTSVAAASGAEPLTQSQAALIEIAL